MVRIQLSLVIMMWFSLGIVISQVILVYLLEVKHINANIVARLSLMIPSS